MSDKTVIFMVEDETSVLAANRRMLARRGYQVDQAACASEAYSYLEQHTPDLMILDIMLPDGSGYDICRSFREKSDNPVLFLTGKDAVADKIEGLARGGDYYLTKPYNFAELLAVVNRLLEREEKRCQKEEHMSLLQQGPLELDLKKNLATLHGEPLALTAKELGLLSVFMQNEGRELSAEELYAQVWNTDSAHDTRTIRKHIMNLRAKIMAGETDEYDIVTAYGKGYTFRCN